jgi:hypothetical protein
MLPACPSNFKQIPARLQPLAALLFLHGFTLRRSPDGWLAIVKSRLK